jgi:hypothetical protein
MIRTHSPKRQPPFLSMTVIVLLLALASFQSVSAATAPSLGTAGAFAVLGGSAVTNTGPTVLNGNLGVSPGSAITGFPPGVVVPPGTIHAADAIAAGAQSDNTIAYNALAGQPCNFNLTGQDLGGLTLIPGVYCFATSAQLTGTLTLDGQGDPNAVFVFQIGSTLTTASGSSVNIINGGSGCNLFWQVGSSATLGTATSFVGNILASTSITLNTGASVSGRTLAQNGAVTLDSSNVSITQCNALFIAPPAIVKVFGAAVIGVGGSTPLSFTINNPNATIALTGVAFTDSLPAGLIVSTPNGLTGSCGGGTIAAVASSGSIALTGATLAAGTSCTFSVNVTGTTTGAYTNSVAVSSGNGGAGNTSITSLTVLAAPPPIGPPTIIKAFGAAAIGVGGTTTLTFTINNPNAVFVLTGVGFTDTLPAGLIVSTPNGLVGSCGGGPIGAPAGSGSISLASAILGAGTSCTFSVNVTATTAGVYTNNVAVTSDQGAGNTSTVLLTVFPILATVQVCKVAGAGVTPGTNFSFSVAATPVIVAAGPAPNGTCAPPTQVAAGSVLVTETMPAATFVTDIHATPGGALVTSNLAAGTATVTANGIVPTVVTFTDAANGLVQVCKVAGAGIAVGTNFNFNVGGTIVTVPAGPGPGGTCGPSVAVPAGGVLITESLPAGTALASVSANGGLLVSSNLAAGTATVSVSGGATAIVTFVDIVPVAGQGFVQVCKAAGSGIAVGTNFNFNVAGTPVTVPAGSCGVSVGVPAGTSVVTETPSAGSVLTGIFTLPNPGLLVSSNLAAGAATVTVLSGAQTIVTFINTAPGAANGTDVSFQVGYAANLNIGDSFINIINTGANGAPLFGPGVGAPSGNICLNTYVFNAGEELIACCSCLVTPNQVVNLGVNRDLVANPAHIFTGNSVTVKLLATLAGIGGAGTSCFQSAATATRANIVSGIAAWGTTIHALVPLNLQTVYAQTETPFTPATLGDSELASITGRCTAILGNGSNFGVCSACRLGALGADKQQ